MDLLAKINPLVLVFIRDNIRHTRELQIRQGEMKIVNIISWFEVKILSN